MIINGVNRNFEEGITISQLLKHLNLNLDTLVVEVNLEIVAKSEYTFRKLNKKDEIEIINFVGGG